MSARPREADVVLIGLGAAGGIAAHVLTQAGLDVVALEAGPRVDASMIRLDQIHNDFRSPLSRPKFRDEIPTWRSSSSETAGPSPWPMLMVNAVGGSTIHYDCASFRFLPWHFAARSQTVARYGEGVIPPGSTLADWPLDYEELEPYYDEVEHAIGVSGKAGNLRGEPDSAGNVFEGARSRDYPMPPVRQSGWMNLLADAARGLGWHPFSVPSAVNSEPYNGNPECTFCGYCQCGGCYRSAKGSLDVTLIPRAEATGHLRIETGARATEIEVGPEGLARGVRCVQAGRERFESGRVVLLGGFVFENTRLLLLSRSTAFPAGLSNNHGQVGKHFMVHLIPFAHAVFPGRRLNRFNGSGAQIICLDDWNADNFDHADLGFIGGSLLASKQEVKPVSATTDLPPPGVPRWGSAWKGWLRTNAVSVGSAFGQIENLSYETNVLDLDPVVRDSYGVPVVRVTHRVGEHERRGWDFMRAKLEMWLAEAGAAQTWSGEQMQADGRHPYGGTRMGNDPETSVVDRFGFSHEVPNLGVIGASTFPTTGGHNPTLTLQALAWRTAAHLVERWDDRSPVP